MGLQRSLAEGKFMGSSVWRGEGVQVQVEIHTSFPTLHLKKKSKSWPLSMMRMCAY